MLRSLLLCLLAASCATPGSSLSAHRDARPVFVEVEGGALWQNRNDVQIPNDDGTRFSISDLIGEGAYAVGRVTADWDLNPRHAVRAVIAPIETDGSGELTEATDFDGQTFAAGVPTDATYRFNSYRLGYRYTYLHTEHWRLRVGGTAFIRDAKIELQQGAQSASDSNVGFVPLANLAAEYYPARQWRMVAELDAAAASQGRAFDFSLKAHYDFNDRCSASVGYRTIEGGADNDDVFTFAWLNAVVASIGFRF
ncbi:MAG: hypothetical protein AAFZ65_04955 [Planctomycetota bacterium]